MQESLTLSSPLQGDVGNIQQATRLLLKNNLKRNDHLIQPLIYNGLKHEACHVSKPHIMACEQLSVL